MSALLCLAFFLWSFAAGEDDVLSLENCPYESKPNKSHISSNVLAFKHAERSLPACLSACDSYKDSYCASLLEPSNLGFQGTILDSIERSNPECEMECFENADCVAYQMSMSNHRDCQLIKLPLLERSLAGYRVYQKRSCPEETWVAEDSSSEPLDCSWTRHAFQNAPKLEYVTHVDARGVSDYVSARTLDLSTAEDIGACLGACLKDSNCWGVNYEIETGECAGLGGFLTNLEPTNGHNFVEIKTVLE